MDYLVSEGYPSAAQKFALEANIQPKVEFDSMRERVEIRNAIYRGDIQSAIEKINELNHQVDFPYFSLNFEFKRPEYFFGFAMIRHRSCTTHTPYGNDEKNTQTTSVFSLSNPHYSDLNGFSYISCIDFC